MSAHRSYASAATPTALSHAAAGGSSGGSPGHSHGGNGHSGSKEAPVAALKELEHMILGLGGPLPASLQAAQQQQRVTGTSALRTVVSKATKGDDCFDAQARKLTQYSTHRAASCSVAASPSVVRGASMAGKDRPEKRYVGKGFQPPPAESPGPIYRPPPGFAEEATIGNAGYSFGRAPREQSNSRAQLEASMASPTFATPSCIGKQSVSTSKTATSASFPSAPRFNDKIFISAAHSKNSHATDTPGPAAYIDDVTRLPTTGRRAPSAVMLGNKESQRKVFISKAHVVDSMGSATAHADLGGPINTAPDSRYTAAPAFSFGTSGRGAGAAVSPAASVTVGADPDKVMTKERRRALAREAMRQNTPILLGPGEYDVKMDAVTGTGPKAVFPTAGKTDKIFWNRELSTHRGHDSPGMCYSPTYVAVERHVPAASFAKQRGVEPDKTYDRFGANQFIGKAFASGLGAASPGPVYDPPSPPNDGPKYTMQGKERHFERKVFPGPSRPRWVSRESAKDNLGAYGPGPKYDTRQPFTNPNAGFSFGTSKRSSSTEPSSAAGGLAKHSGAGSSEEGRPPRSRSADLLAASQQRATSPRNHIPGPCMVPPTHRSRSPTGNGSARDVSPPTGPHTGNVYAVTEPRAVAVSFTTAPRFGAKAAQVGQQGQGPGPVYSPNFNLLEKRAPAVAFGGLP